MQHTEDILRAISWGLQDRNYVLNQIELEEGMVEFFLANVNFLSVDIKHKRINNAKV